MESRAEAVVTTERATNTVSTGLHNVNFTGCGPSAVRVDSREHPDGRPDPIALGELCIDLNSTVSKIERVNSSQACAHYRVEVISTTCGASFTTVESVAGAYICGRSTPDRVSACLEGSFADRLNSQRWLNVQNTVFNEGVCPVVAISFEFPIATTSQGELVLPLLEVQFVEIVFKDKSFGLDAYCCDQCDEC